MPEKYLSCENFAQSCLSRREWLQIGGASALSLSLPLLLQSRSTSTPRGAFGKAKAAILLYLHGGPAQQETWDPKPNGPLPERGEFGAIATSVPGAWISEMLPRCSRLMHRLTVIRSMNHDNSNHVQASLPAMTGHAHPESVRKRGDFPPSSTDFPPFGAVLDQIRPHRSLPTWVQLGPLMRRNNGTVLHGQVPGFLGHAHAPLMIDPDLKRESPQVESVSLSPDLSSIRLSQRKNLLAQIDAQQRHLASLAEVQKLNGYQQRALSILTSPKIAQACDLRKEPNRSRDRYGRTEFGQRCLLARRLVESGVPLVNVHYCLTPKGSWDTHGKHFRQMKQSLGPTFDAAFSALIEDLDQRGILQQTLVLANAEFGRTPKINKNAGRDHWPWAYSLAMAGGGTAPGTVYGSTDKIAAYPDRHPHSPADMAATIYHLIGIPPTTVIQDQTGRPHTLVIGKTIDGLLG